MSDSQWVCTKVYLYDAKFGCKISSIEVKVSSTVYDEHGFPEQAWCSQDH